MIWEYFRSNRKHHRIVMIKNQCSFVLRLIICLISMKNDTSYDDCDQIANLHIMNPTHRNASHPDYLAPHHEGIILARSLSSFRLDLHDWLHKDSGCGQDRRGRSVCNCKILSILCNLQGNLEHSGTGGSAHPRLFWMCLDSIRLKLILGLIDS